MRRFNSIGLIGTGILIGVITYLFEDLDDELFDIRYNQYYQYNNNIIIILYAKKPQPTVIQLIRA